MSRWFDENDKISTVINHLDSKTPDSIRDEAKRELRERGWTDRQIHQAVCGQDVDFE